MKFPRARILTALTLCSAINACGDATTIDSDRSGDDAGMMAAPLRSETPPNLLVFLIDTQRADYLGAYGHAAPTSPELDSYAQESLVFERAYAPASSTSPSHASLFTSTHPRIHGVWNRVPRGEGEDPIFPALSPKAITLAEVLNEAGYDTAAICDGGNLQENRGFAQGFSVWDSKFSGAENRVDRALRWLDTERDADLPFFLFLHTYQVHTPYLPEEQYVEQFADPNYRGPLREAWQRASSFWASSSGVRGAIRKIQGDFYKPALPAEGEAPNAEDLAFLKALYQAEIKQMDTAFGRLVDELAARGITPDNTLILITSDHGEEFWEHGQYGHHQIYDTTAHIPFIVRGPGTLSGVRRSDPVDLLDVMPTLLYWAGIEVDYLPPSMLGRVLDFGSKDAPGNYTVVGESNWPEHQWSWRVGDRKAMLFPGSGRATEVYDFAQDPGEQDDLAARQASWVESVQPDLQAWAEHAVQWQSDHQLAPGVRDWNKLTQAERDALIGMGYVDPEEIDGN
ncbi:MAG: sulfatase [Planctomycetes bacterium]|nr:sulfatase [Planctomycetota bacterium]